jgi:hypothetical protein
MNTDSRKIILLHWIGRFGNRMFQYAFGCSYAKKYNCTFYIPSEWEGTIIFKPNKYCKIITDEKLCLDINNIHTTDESIKNSLNNYNSRNGDTVEYVSFDNKSNIGKINIAFNDLHCMYFTFCFHLFDPELIKEIYTFNDNVLQSEIYKWYYDNKNKYDVVHLRRGDISELNFVGSHSMISKESYYKQLDILKINRSEVIWVTESEKDRSINKWNTISQGHRWKYPSGEMYCPIIFLDFLPDFLNMLFARTLLRGNSSLSWWAAFLSTAVVYSPIIKPKPLENKNKYYCLETEFIKGNYPHFMGSKLEADCFNDIIFTQTHRETYIEPHIKTYIEPRTQHKSHIIGLVKWHIK